MVLPAAACASTAEAAAATGESTTAEASSAPAPATDRVGAAAGVDAATAAAVVFIEFAEQPPEEDEEEQLDDEISRFVFVADGVAGDGAGADVFATGGLDEGVDPGGDSGVEIAALEGGANLVLDDPFCGDVGDGTFEPVADFDAHLPVGDEKEEDCSIVFIILADAPRFCGAVGEIFECRPLLELLKNGDDDLAGALPLECFEAVFESALRPGGEDVCVVVYISRWLRWERERGCAREEQEQNHGNTETAELGE